MHGRILFGRPKLYQSCSAIEGERGKGERERRIRIIREKKKKKKRG